MKPNFAVKSSLLAGLIALSACASSPPKKLPPPESPKIKSGDQMLMESQNLAQFGERWKLGQQRVHQGEELVRQGQIKIEEGERLIEEGKKIMKESEDAYQGIKQ
ncbi:MAG: hypothetical protein PHE55_01570 [Methylococcaceae bacterium]|nr:hypothetical protein [Methylococcaceae bacterium]